ncbi:HNH endonuclease [Candidatus Pacearchaeota archaeon]|nr:HNH endonuclease [Candidatus Pacearchaeota archaeon]
MNSLDYKTAHRCFRVDLQTGILSWRVRPAYHFRSSAGCRSANRRYSGEDTSSGVGGEGYKRVRVFGKLYLQHRIVFLMIYGRWPSGVTDRIDRVRNNNRPDNLRDASFSLNCQNKDGYGKVASKGVSFAPRNTLRPFVAKSLGKNGKYLGAFETEALASTAVQKDFLSNFKVNS